MNWNYLAECLRLLYWIYFKPFTLAEWLREIHPDLKSNTNPFTMRSEFRGNPKLRRYAGQVWWLTVAVPVVAVLIVGIIYSLVVEPFNWSRSSLFWIGWLLGNLIVRGDNSSLQKWLTLITWIVISIIVPQSLKSQFSLVEIGVMLSMGFGVAEDVAGAAAFGMAFGMAFGVGFGVGFGVAGGVAGA
ncbi:MAG: hypothetical protein ACRC62_11090, partial [Microcoleus sp.]